MVADVEGDNLAGEDIPDDCHINEHALKFDVGQITAPEVTKSIVRDTDIFEEVCVLILKIRFRLGNEFFLIPQPWRFEMKFVLTSANFLT